MSNGRHNSAGSLSVLLVTGEQRPPVERVFEQILGHRTWLHKVKLDREVDSLVLKRISEAWTTFKPHLLLAGSTAAWNTFRALNIWQSQGRLFGTSKEQNRKPPIVIALPGYSGETLLDYYPCDPATGDWLKRFLREFQQQRELDPKNNEAKAKLALLKKAMLGAVAASARHSITLPGNANDHGRNDVIAAIRVLQGAMLDGALSAKDGRFACDKVMTLARRFQPGLALGERWKKSGFTRLVGQHIADRRERIRPTCFGSILIADDSGFWVEAFRPIWKRLGLRPVGVKVAKQVNKVVKRAAKSSHSVRVILLDMRFNGDNLAGAKVLSNVSKVFEHMPVVALSVDDQFSETVVLKRMGAFAYLNKHALAEPHRGRDAVSAFRQMQDAILAAAFASLAEDFERLWHSIAKGCRELMKAELKLGLAERSQQSQAARSLKAVGGQVHSSLAVYREECRRLFHGFWQDSVIPPGLARRQIIRALGLINDQWCSLWKMWRFDPDRDDGYWVFGVNVEFPYLAYHKIATAIRGEASHAMLKDSAFEWLDVWIMFLALFLKVEGTTRTFLKANGLNDFDSDLNRQIDVIVKALGQLLKACGVIEKHPITEERSETLREQMAVSLHDLDTRLKAYLQFAFTENGFPEGNELRLTVQSFLNSKRNYYPFFDGYAEKCRGTANFSRQQLQAHLLLLDLITKRIPARVSG